MSRVRSLFLLYLVLFVLVPVAAAQDIPGVPTTEDILGPVAAIAVAVNAFVEFVKPRVRTTKFSVGVQDSLLLLIAVSAGIAAVFMAGGAANLFPNMPVRYQTFALILTGVVAAFGAEFLHVLVDFLYAGRDWLRPTPDASEKVSRSDLSKALRRNVPVPEIGTAKGQIDVDVYPRLHPSPPDERN